MTEARIWAQAKINVLLRVLARELSGYHSIETVFLRLEVGDDVVVRVGGASRNIDCRGADVGPAERNLAYRAALAYADATGWPNGFSIEIDKHVPVGGGLGGGSADAGAVLRALDALSPKPLGPRLVEVATPLGADVPFLTIDSPMALGWGRGDRLLALPPLPSRPLALVLPGFGVATKDAYAWLSESRAGVPTPGPVLTLDLLGNWRGVASVATNDFEPVVVAHHPELASHLEAMRQQGAVLAMMCGSGSSLFAIYEGKPSSASLSAATGARVLTTRTAERVVGVELTR